MPRTWETPEGRCRCCNAPQAACHEQDCWLVAAVNAAVAVVEKQQVSEPATTAAAPYRPEWPEVERGALWCVMEGYPPTMDLPTILWGASTALLYVRRVTAGKGRSQA